MTSLLTSQWLDACVLVPADDFAIIQQLEQRAAAEGLAVSDLAGLRKYALTTDVNDAEASLVNTIEAMRRVHGPESAEVRHAQEVLEYARSVEEESDSEEDA